MNGQVLFEVFKSRYTLLSPLKILPLVKQLEKRITSVRSLRDEPI